MFTGLVWVLAFGLLPLLGVSALSGLRVAYQFQRAVLFRLGEHDYHRDDAE